MQLTEDEKLDCEEISHQAIHWLLDISKQLGAEPNSTYLPFILMAHMVNKALPEEMKL